MKTTHPCFNAGAKGRFGRIHLPVAPACNIQCGYCDRKCDCVNESRPGVTAQVLTPAQACARAVETIAAMPELSVVGIAGPGDPLANAPQTLETFERVHKALPSVLLCLSTNGLALPEHADRLAAIGVKHVTVTVNAVDPAIGAQIYRHVQGPDKRLEGEDGASLLLERQKAGINRIAELGVTVKVNCVIVPGINDHHVEAVAKSARKWGASLMNCIPMLPVAGTALAHLGQPDCKTMHRVRMKAAAHVPQMKHCARCRADAVGLIGQEIANAV